jgi:formate dehydrogenase subunit beta
MKQGTIGIDRCYGDAVRMLLARMLDGGLIRAAVVPVESPGGTKIDLMLVGSKAGLERARPMAPYFFGNRALGVSRLTRLGELPERTAVVLRPCELRSLIELRKLRQVSSGSLLLICTDCPGTLPAKDFREKKAARADFHALLTKACFAGEDLEGARQACSVCLHPSLEAHADLLVGTFGQERAVLLLAASAGGEEVLGALGLDEAAPAQLSARRSALARLTSARKTRHEAWRAGLGFAEGKLEALERHFDACEQCRACSEICPVCYCKQCAFKLAAMEADPAARLLKAMELDAIALPDSPLLFHLGRMTHMAHACTGCGACTEACPAGIDVARAFIAAGEAVQALFGYEAGRDPAEPMPLTVFREHELEEKIR